MNFYSQFGQDKFIIENFFKNKTTGFYVDIGANDGVDLSNTKTLEEIGWKGVCVEPLPDKYEQLTKNRTSECLNIAISNKDDILDFLFVEGYPQMLSGLVENYNPKHLERIKFEIENYGGKSQVISVQSKRFSDIIDEVEIDYVSIDVEGSELSILESIDFDKHNIKLFSVESNYEQENQKIVDFLASKNYFYIKSIGCDDFFAKE